MKKIIGPVAALVFGLSTIVLSGCGESRPDGMPELYRTTIRVTQGSEGLANATVSLFPEDSALGRWPSGGVTDENGKVSLVTYTKFDGAPAGKFKVIVNKTVTEGDPIPERPTPSSSPEDRAAYDRAMKTGSFEVFQVVAEEYRTADKTPLAVEISPDSDNSFDLDVGAPVKEKDVDASATGGKAEYVPMGGA